MSCLCTGMCRTTGGCPNRGNYYYDYPYPHSTIPEYYRVVVGKDQVLIGWVCPKCDTVNNPKNVVCAKC